jgi:murein DD-endopeptidase MepM/ murein hydrolase activator NlpD
MDTTELQYPLKREYRVLADFADHLRRRSVSPGVDFDTPTGTEVLAAAAGTVLKSIWNPVGGRFLIMAHTDEVLTLYSHLDTVHVLRGEPVRAGQVIATSGSTGNTVRPHLHFAVRLPGSDWVNPVHQIPAWPTDEE